ncbi:MAG TPA: hypothetical protein DCS55_09525, partial [Acidimicrobiaceae bacterium]|nr:hypothetical protein [Acidimicrobiaceae bacterium]
GRLDDAVLQCAPDVVLHDGGDEQAGIDALRRWWDTSPQLGAGAAPEITGVGPDTFELAWDDPSPNRIRVRVAHGLISAQWHEAAAGATDGNAEDEGRSVGGTVEISSAGSVTSSELAYAEDKVAKVLADVGRPVLHTDIRLERSADASLERPAMARLIVLV